MTAEQQPTEAPFEGDLVTVSTMLPSLPFPPNAQRPDVVTERLILRPPRQQDLQGFHHVRSQPEVMVWSTAGRPDLDLAESQRKLDQFLPPNDAETFNFVICWKETDEVIGIGGSHHREGEYGWPETGYILSKDFWGRGLATELLHGFLGAYARLPRSAAQLKVHKSSVVAVDGAGGPGEPIVAQEVLTATVQASNERSHGVLRKCGFERFLTHAEADSRDPSQTISLVGHRYLVAARSGGP